MLQDFLHKLKTTQVGPEMNTFGYNCNGVEMAGDTHWLKTTLCWVYEYEKPQKDLCISKYVKI